MDFSFTKIECETHPAFQHLASNNKYNQQAIENLVSKIDSAFTEIENASLSLLQVKFRFFRQIKPLIRELRHLTIPHTTRDNSKKLLDLALSEVQRQLELDLRFRSLRNKYTSKMNQLGQLQKNAISDLQTHGVSVSSVSADLIQEVSLAIKEYENTLKNSWQKNPTGRAALSLPRDSKVWEKIEAYLNQCKMVEIASEYKQAPMDLIYLALDYANDKQTWYKDCYADKGIPTTKAAYMHCDYGYDMLKGMLYLNETKSNNGCFQFIKGSHLWPRSPFLFALYRDMDLESIKVLGSDLTAYYRRRFSNEELRKDFMDLPPLFRGSSHFGDDLLDDSVNGKNLLAKEYALEGGPGTLVLFDGEKGVHRGSLCSSGERLAIQLGFRGPDLRTLDEKIKDKITRKWYKLLGKTKPSLNH